jgi:hypothetical protein
VTVQLTRMRMFAYAIVIAAALAYPLAIMAGGLPRFPSRADCVRPATQDGEGLEVVFGHIASLGEAADLQAKALRVGFQGTQVTHDGCGRYKVAIPGVPSIKVGEEIIAEARSVGLEATLEQAG